MDKKLIIAGFCLLGLLAAAGILFLSTGDKPVYEKLPENKMALQGQGSGPDKRVAPVQKTPARGLIRTRTSTQASRENVPRDTLKALEKPDQRSPVNYPVYVEEIKKQIYDKEIEDVEQIPLLDELVQTGNKDVREFWGDGWTSVDDWKKNSNGFTLEKNKDGALVFTPDEETARIYTFFESPLAYQYDEKNREFVNEVDYYGKTIYNVVKFIRDDVMVMMTISGRKVDLNIYWKNAIPD